MFTENIVNVIINNSTIFLQLKGALNYSIPPSPSPHLYDILYILFAFCMLLTVINTVFVYLLV